MWTKVRQITVKTGDPNALCILECFGGEHLRLDSFRPWKPRFRRNRRQSSEPAEAHALALKRGLTRYGINEAKKLDLLNLCDSGLIPRAYRDFFKSLPLQNYSQ